MILIDREAKLAGIVTRGDVLRSLDEDPAAAMSMLDPGSRKLVVTYPDEGLREAAAEMLRNNIGRLPVLP